MPVVSRLSTAPVKGTALHHHQKPQSRSLCTSTGKRAAELCGWVKHCSAWWAPCLVALSLTKTRTVGRSTSIPSRPSWGIGGSSPPTSAPLLSTSPTTAKSSSACTPPSKSQVRSPWVTGSSWQREEAPNSDRGAWRIATAGRDGFCGPGRASAARREHRPSAGPGRRRHPP